MSNVDFGEVESALPNFFSMEQVCENYLVMLKRKVKFSMARSLPLENLLPQNVGSIINYLQ